MEKIASKLKKKYSVKYLIQNCRIQLGSHMCLFLFERTLLQKMYLAQFCCQQRLFEQNDWNMLYKIPFASCSPYLSTVALLWANSIQYPVSCAKTISSHQSNMLFHWANFFMKLWFGSKTVQIYWKFKLSTKLKYSIITNIEF